VTAGVLLRRMLADPGSTAWTVVIDEVHERALETDLLIGLLGEVRELRDDLTLVAMSATLDAERIAAVIGTDARRRSSSTRSPRIRSPSAGRRAPRGWTSAASPGLPRPRGPHRRAAARDLVHERTADVLVFCRAHARSPRRPPATTRRGGFDVANCTDRSRRRRRMR
jgi:ATP-dependent helicase HrpB